MKTKQLNNIVFLYIEQCSSIRLPTSMQIFNYCMISRLFCASNQENKIKNCCKIFSSH